MYTQIYDEMKKASADLQLPEAQIAIVAISATDPRIPKVKHAHHL